jgi:hypothetical protein
MCKTPSNRKEVVHSNSSLKTEDSKGPGSQEQFWDEFDFEVSPNECYGQLFIEFNSPSKTIQDAKKIIEESGLRIVETKRLSARWALIKLDVKDIRDITLKLIENGFFNIRGFNVSNQKIE